MSKITPDRRVQRTRQLLQDALVSLILEKGYQKITIQEIIDRANVGRSTFYSHYRDKDDLLLSGFDELAHDLNRHMQAPDNPDDDPGHLLHSLEFFIHACDNRELYIAMVDSGGGDLIFDIARQILQPAPGQTSQYPFLIRAQTTPELHPLSASL